MDKLVYNNDMVNGVSEFKHIVIAPHPEIAVAVEESKHIVTFLEDQGLQVTMGLLFDDDLRQKIVQGEFDLLVALGGDGTMLRAGHLCGPHGIPILGINMGRFGFLMEIRQDGWKDAFKRLFRGNFWYENRMMLKAEQVRGDQVLGEWEVVNEAVVSRGGIVRPVQMEVSVDGRFLATYVADGMIASTPTGSTAYALAAGGPILPPELRTILLVPIAPHLSIDRGIVLAEGSSVAIKAFSTHEAVLSVDGQPPIDLADGDCVNIRASDHNLQFIRFQDPGYFYRNLTPHMNQNPSTGNIR
ncbi:MAG: NAD(+)/NADH kinase [Chloroflexota bacterium]|nr:MAG: NAD(+)/NADH kinase [Chloroflexota bacterium]